MNISPSKENILKKIRKALSSSTPLPFAASEGNNSLYQPGTQELELHFAEAITQLQGKFAFCMNLQDLVQQLEQLVTLQQWPPLYCIEEALTQQLKGAGFTNFNTTDLANCPASITTCEALVARTGTIVLSSATASGRTASVYAPVHICIAYTHQLVYDVKDALQLVKDKYAQQLPSLISFASGPSRTADIEKTLVVGVHGPKEVYVFLVDA